LALWGSSCCGNTRVVAGKAATWDLPGMNGGDNAGGDVGGVARYPQGGPPIPGDDVLQGWRGWMSFSIGWVGT